MTPEEQKEFPQVNIFKNLEDWKKSIKPNLIDPEKKDEIVSKLSELKKTYDALPIYLRNFFYRRMELIRSHRKVKPDAQVKDIVKLGGDTVSTLFCRILFDEEICDKDREILLAKLNKEALFLDGTELTENTIGVIAKRAWPTLGKPNPRKAGKETFSAKTYFDGLKAIQNV